MKKSLVLITQTLLALLITQGFVLFTLRMLKEAATVSTLALPAVTARQFLFTFLVVTAIVLFLVRTLRQRIVFEVIFLLSIFSGIWFLSALLSPAYGIFIALGLTALRYVFPYIVVQNLLLMAGIAGIGSALGSATTWQTAIVILLVLAFYDVIAVYGTKHMVTMFKGLLEKGVIFAIIIPERPRMLLRRMREVSSLEGFFFLGTGDLVLPSFFVASAARENLGLAFGAAVGSIVGLFFTDLLFSWGRRRPMPALPPIVLGTLAGFFVVMLVQRML